MSSFDVIGCNLKDWHTTDTPIQSEEYIVLVDSCLCVSVWCIDDRAPADIETRTIACESEYLEMRGYTISDDTGCRLVRYIVSIDHNSPIEYDTILEDELTGIGAICIKKPYIVECHSRTHIDTDSRTISTIDIGRGLCECNLG